MAAGQEGTEKATIYIYVFVCMCEILTLIKVACISTDGDYLLGHVQLCGHITEENDTPILVYIYCP